MPQTSPTPRSKTSSPPASGPRLEGAALARRIAELCREKRGADVVTLDVRRLVDYMDFLVLVTGTSERQNRAIADHVLRSLRPAKVRPLSTAGEDGGTWICVDF